MPNRPSTVSLNSFQHKLDAFKTKIALQQLLAQSLQAELESLSSDFESLKQLFDASFQEIGSTSENFGVTSIGNESSSENFGVTSIKFDSSSEQFVASSSKLGVTSLGNGSTSKNFDVPSPGSGSSSLNHGASSIQSEAPTTNNGASSSIRELSVLIQRSARESLRIYFSKPDIPSRMARIILTLKERKKLSVAEMRQITGVSRNSIGRDMKVLKLLGWLEFHGSRKNGYFTLTASFPGAF